MTNKVFKLLGVRKLPPLSLVRPGTTTTKMVKAEPESDLYERTEETMLDATEKRVTELLFQFELAEKTRQRLREENPDVFDKLDRIEESQKEAREELRRLLHTKDGPPPIVKPGTASHTWARGENFLVEVHYKKYHDYYDPKKLPLAVFSIPGVVVKVDTEVLDKLSKKDGRIRVARTFGGWMTPAVSVRRMSGDE